MSDQTEHSIKFSRRFLELLMHQPTTSNGYMQLKYSTKPPVDYLDYSKGGEFWPIEGNDVNLLMNAMKPGKAVIQPDEVEEASQWLVEWKGKTKDMQYKGSQNNVTNDAILIPQGKDYILEPISFSVHQLEMVRDENVQKPKVNVLIPQVALTMDRVATPRETKPKDRKERNHSPLSNASSDDLESFAAELEADFMESEMESEVESTDIHFARTPEIPETLFSGTIINGSMAAVDDLTFSPPKQKQPKTLSVPKTAAPRSLSQASNHLDESGSDSD